MLFSKVMRVSNRLSTLVIVGTLLLTRLSYILAQSPVNDKCSAASTISSIPFSLNGIDTSLATSDVNTTICSVVATDVGVWFSFLGNDKVVKIALTNPTFNAKIAVFSGTCNVLTCVDDSGSADTFTWQAALNVPYLILVSGFSQAKGTFNMQITDVPRPPNESCENAVAITSNAIPQGYDTIGAFSDFTAPDTCFVNNVVRGIWFKFTPASDRIYTVATSAGTFFHRINIFTGPSCGNLGCFDAVASGSFSTLSIEWAGKAGQPYYILVTGLSSFSHVGTFTIGITDVPRPPNDSCENAVAISSNAIPQGYDTIGAFSDFTAPDTCFVNNVVRGVWFKFTPSNDRIFTVTTSAGTFFHRINIFTGPSCGNLGCFDAVASGSFSTLSIEWAGKAGQSYYILVTGLSSFSHVGTFTIGIADVPRPPNDSCENAIAISSNAAPQGYDTIGAFSDFTVPITCFVNNVVRGVWFKFTPSNDRIFTVTTSAGTFFHRINIFTGPSCGNLGCFDAVASGSFSTLSIKWAGKAGQPYYILVTGLSSFSHVGTFTIGITDIPRPKNDDCVTAIEVVSSNTTKNGDTSGSFVDLIVGPQCTLSTTARGSWYFFVGGGGTVRAAISDAVFNAKLIVFSGPCNNVGCVGNNDGAATTAVVTFPTVVGVKYYLLVTGIDFFDTGTFVLTVSGDVQGPTISPTVKPFTLPPNTVPVPVSPSTPVVTPPSPVIAPPSPVVAPSKPPSGFFRRLFQALFGWILK